MDVPESVTWLLAATGLILVLAGIIGGGFELKELKMPKLSGPTRALSTLGGVVLIALALLDAQAPGPARDEPDAVPDPVPRVDVTTLQEEEGRAMLLQSGATVGRVRTVKAWAPHGTILEQNEITPTPPGASKQLELIVADSDFEFEAIRSVSSSDDEDIDVEVVYGLRLVQVPGGAAPVIQFTPTRIDVREGLESTDVLDRLQGETGYLERGALEDFDLAASWAAFSRTGADLAHAMDEASLQAQGGGRSIGSTFLLMLAGVEVRFDLISMLAMSEEQSLETSSRVQLQEGSELMSEIWLQGPGRIADAGRARTFEIMRRPPDTSRSERIGTASYSTDTALLRNLDMMYRINDDEALYRLRIDQVP